MSGRAVIVDGEIVAWFKDFDDGAQEWCSANHFGKWLTWRSTSPSLIPMTEEEFEQISKEADELALKLAGAECNAEDSYLR